MNVKEEKICRLCLKVAENDYEIIDENSENTRKIYEILLLRVNLFISTDTIICQDCADMVEKCFNFKSACINSKESVFSHDNDKKRAMSDLKDVCKEEKDIDALNDNVICRFCLNHLSGSNFVLLDTLMSDVTEMFPEMDFNIMKNPIICTTCNQNLQCYIKFVEACLDVEEKINQYVQNQGTSSSARVKLSEILRPLSKNISTFDYTQMCAIKEEVVIEDIIKSEEVIFSENAYEIPSDKLNIPCEWKPQIGEDQKASTQLNSSSTDYHNNLLHENIEVEMHKCSTCTYETKDKSNFKRHKLIHKDSTEVEMYKCSVCTFETKRKFGLKNHMLLHKNLTEVEMMNKCSMCTYETKYMGNLKRHTLIHKDNTEVKMYKCSMCNYETKHKGYLKTHMVIHNDIIEVKMHKCPVCTFESKRKYSLKSHMLLHKNITEVKMINKCSMCTYETKYIGNLKRHIVIHKDNKEVKMYQCSMCTFETKHNRYLKTHMVIHKDISEMETYKCSSCTYETVYKSNLKNHKLTYGHYGDGNV